MNQRYTLDVGIIYIYIYIRPKYVLFGHMGTLGCYRGPKNE